MSENKEPTGLKKIMQNKKIQELFWYIVFGVLTTLVNLIVFALLDKLIGAQWDVKIFKWEIDLFNVFINVVAWVAAIVFAYVTNKLFVFHTKGNVLKEFISFVVARLFTFFAFEVGLFSVGLVVMENTFNMPAEEVFISLLGFDVTNKYIVKMFIAVFVVVANYVFSKLFIFKKTEEKKEVTAGVQELGKSVEEEA